MNEQEIQKKPYVQPVLKRIELKTDEIILGFCAGSSSAQSGPLCQTTACVN